MSPETRPDPVHHPQHYTFGGIEVIDALEAWNLGYHLGNVIKYVVRSKHKGNYLQDLQKARWYLDREIQRAHNDLQKQPGPERVPPNTLVGSTTVSPDVPNPVPLTCARCGRAMYEGHTHDCIPFVANVGGGDLPVQVQKQGR